MLLISPPHAPTHSVNSDLLPTYSHDRTQVTVRIGRGKSHLIASTGKHR